MLRYRINDGFAAFSPTYILDSDYLGRRNAGLRLFSCSCRAGRLFRVRRSFWMRVLLRMRLYQCARCGNKVLRLKIKQPSRTRYPLDLPVTRRYRG